MGIATLATHRRVTFELEITGWNENGTARIQLTVENVCSVELKATCVFKAYAEAVEYLEHLFGSPVIAHIPTPVRRPKNITAPDPQEQP